MVNYRYYLGLLFILGLLAACSPTGATTAVTTPSPLPEQMVANRGQPYKNRTFSLEYPTDFTLYENERLSADGVLAPAPDSISLHHPDVLLTLTTFHLEEKPRLVDFITDHQPCANLLPGQPTTVGNLPAMLFADTLCGLSGTSYLFATVGQTGFRFEIETAADYAAIQPTVQPILDSFQSVEDPATEAQITHKNITFSYDPTLLGEVNIFDLPATPNQGLFENPTPAHTWIGFVPHGIQRDFSNHWQLAWEPAIFVYSLNDFGSFAAGDVAARQHVAQLQALVAEQPPTFNEAIPIIPPINSGQVIRSRVQWLEFNGGVGVRFVTQYDQSVNPINNEGLVYLFQGMTDDGRLGVTAVFPLDAAFLPDDPMMDEAAYSAFIEYFEAEMLAVTRQLNTAPDSEFNPSLLALDGLIQSMVIIPSATEDFAIASEPEHAQVDIDAQIFGGPNENEVVGTLEAGDPVIVNGRSEDGRYRRILCLDGTTGSCWLEADVIAPPVHSAGPVLFTGGLPDVGDVVGITAVSTNTIYDGPGETYQPVGELMRGESVSVFGADETGAWLAVACPRGIGVACWVIADTAVNEPTSFVLGDGWQDIHSEFVTFRVPAAWQPTAVTPGMGSVLAEWHLGIPEVESDQSIAFFAIPLDELGPNDVVDEVALLIGDQPGVKWVRQGEGYVSYDYFTAGTAVSQAAGAGSFGLHVTLAAADPELESILDMVVASIRFNP